MCVWSVAPTHTNILELIVGNLQKCNFCRFTTFCYTIIVVVYKSITILSKIENFTKIVTFIYTTIIVLTKVRIRKPQQERVLAAAF